MFWLVPPEVLLAYTAAATALVLVPGPAQALILTRSIERGARAGVVTAAGLDAATMVHTAAAAFGLSAILATSAAAFTAVKIAGSAYLIWLGVRMLRATPAGSAEVETAHIERGLPASAGGEGRIFLHGFLTGLLNPKVALFFLAFLPQFVRPERGRVLAQFLLLGGILAALDLVWAVILSTAASRARRRLAQSDRFARWRERLTGAALVALGLKLAFTKR
jgi:threonine/homoserine/homoserine lactone efflux protein